MTAVSTAPLPPLVGAFVDAVRTELEASSYRPTVDELVQALAARHGLPAGRYDARLRVAVESALWGRPSVFTTAFKGHRWDARGRCRYGAHHPVGPRLPVPGSPAGDAADGDPRPDWAWRRQFATDHRSVCDLPAGHALDHRAVTELLALRLRDHRTRHVVASTPQMPGALTLTLVVEREPVWMAAFTATAGWPGLGLVRAHGWDVWPTRGCVGTPVDGCMADDRYLSDPANDVVVGYRAADPGRLTRAVLATLRVLGLDDAAALAVRTVEHTAVELEANRLRGDRLDRLLASPNLGSTRQSGATSPRGPVLSHCIRCHQPLRTEPSHRRGFGPECWAATLRDPLLNTVHVSSTAPEDFLARVARSGIPRDAWSRGVPRAAWVEELRYTATEGTTEIGHRSLLGRAA